MNDKPLRHSKPCKWAPQKSARNGIDYYSYTCISILLTNEIAIPEACFQPIWRKYPSSAYEAITQRLDTSTIK